MTSNQKRFLILNTKNNKILLLCSNDGISCLADSPYWHADGTFHVASKYYYQLYIIQSWYKDRMIPCAFALMHRRRTQDYKKIFNALKKEANYQGKVLNPESIMTDFELAAIKAFKDIFPAIKNKGCMFHFGQNIMKYLASIGLKTKYIDEEDFRNWINNIFALALCPLNKVDDQWEKCLANEPVNVPRLDEFLDYFVDNYFEGDFPKEMWNHFDNINRPRTNNNLEGYNGKLKKFIVISHPNVFAAVEALQALQEEVAAGDKYHRAIQGYKANPRKKLYVTKDGTYGTYKELFLSGDITFEVYMKRIAEMLIIYRKKKDKIGVAQHNISSSSEEEQADTRSDESSDQEV